MNLKELAMQYRSNGEACRIRAEQLTQLLKTEKLGEMERMRLRRRICILNTMARDAIATSKYLENYYGDDENGEDEYVCEGRRVSVSAKIPEDDGQRGQRRTCRVGKILNRGGSAPAAETACKYVLPGANAHAGYSRRA